MYQGTNGGAHQKPNLARYILRSLHYLQVVTPLHINFLNDLLFKNFEIKPLFLLLPPVDGPFHYPLGMLRFVDFSLCFCTIPSNLFYLQNLSQDSSTQWNKARSSHSLNSQHKKIWNSWCLLCSCRFWQCFRWIGTLSLAVLGFRWILNIPKIDVWPFTKVCFFPPFQPPKRIKYILISTVEPAKSCVENRPKQRSDLKVAFFFGNYR